jgi:hypothetical protein
MLLLIFMLHLINIYLQEFSLEMVVLYKYKKTVITVAIQVGHTHSLQKLHRKNTKACFLSKPIQ